MLENEVLISEPLKYSSLTVFPLFARQSPVEYQLFADGLDDGTVTIRETSESGSIPDSEVDNRGDRRLLLLEGEELVGAKQNRILNTSILVPPRSRLRIPVSCVERGRWRYHSAHFGSSGCHGSYSLRWVLAHSVSRSLGARRGCRSDQMGVWRAIAEEQQALGVVSCTAAMSDTFDSLGASIRDCHEAIPFVEGACGMLVAIGPQCSALDLFDSESTCRKAWSRLLTGYTVDAQRTSTLKGQPEFDQARQFLGQLWDSPWRAVDTVGDGQEYRADTHTGALAIKLCFDGTLVHGRVLFGSGCSSMGG